MSTLSEVEDEGTGKASVITSGFLAIGGTPRREAEGGKGRLRTLIHHCQKGTQGEAIFFLITWGCSSPVSLSGSWGPPLGLRPAHTLLSLCHRSD